MLRRAAVPRRASVDGARAAYTDASTLELKPWVYLGTRLVGPLLVALHELRRS